jgi:hypothetical protein
MQVIVTVLCCLQWRAQLRSPSRIRESNGSSAARPSRFQDGQRRIKGLSGLVKKFVRHLVVSKSSLRYPYRLNLGAWVRDEAQQTPLWRKRDVSIGLNLSSVHVLEVLKTHAPDLPTHSRSYSKFCSPSMALTSQP